MRALLTTGDGVAPSEVPEPRPSPGQALIDVDAISLNRGEIAALAAARPGLPWGWDAAGTVRVPAADGSGPTAGSRVVGLAQPPGAWAEAAVVDTSLLATLPDAVSATAAATLPVAGLTALYALDVAGLLGRRVLITGATGGVGRFAVQLARRGGARHVSALVRDPSAAADLLDLGADELIGEIDPAGPREDVIVDSVGGATLGAAIKRAAANGVVVSLGDTVGEPLAFSPFDLGPNGARLHALRVFTEVRRRATGAQDLAYLASGLADGWLDAQVELVAPWEQAGEAIAALMDRRVRGKVVLTLT